VCVDMKQSSSLSMADERAQQTQAREDRSRGYNDSRTCTSSAQCENGGTCAARSFVCMSSWLPRTYLHSASVMHSHSLSLSRCYNSSCCDRQTDRQMNGRTDVGNNLTRSTASNIDLLAGLVSFGSVRPVHWRRFIQSLGVQSTCLAPLLRFASK